MEIKRSISINNTTSQVAFDETSVCPICKSKIKPHELAKANFISEENEPLFSVLYLCTGCYKTFVSHYRIKRVSQSTYSSILEYTGPEKYAEIKFKKDIEDLSPKFVKIYNESAQAESLGMNEIAGIGYRKAFEFLVKDFFLYIYPNDKDTIVNTSLSQFFNKNFKYRIENEKLNETATASIWIGNDFAHYVQKHETYKIEDLKDLIDATLYLISCELITIKATKFLETEANKKPLVS
jgi:hypothetical protein